MSEVQELALKLQRWRRAAMLLPLLGVVVVFGLGWYARVQRDRAAMAELQATEAGRREAIWKEQAADSDLAAAMNEDKVRMHEATIRTLQARLDRIPRPPAPKPPPAEDADLAAGLVQSGLTAGLRVQVAETPAVLGQADARVVWNWKESALRLPPLEARLETTAALNEALTLQVGAVQAQARSLANSRDAWKQATAACDERAEALGKETKALKRSLQAEKWQKWLMVGGGVAVGYLAGKNVR